MSSFHPTIFLSPHSQISLKIGSLKKPACFITEKIGYPGNKSFRMEIYYLRFQSNPPRDQTFLLGIQVWARGMGVWNVKKVIYNYLDLLTGKSLTVHAHGGRFSILLAVEGDKGVALPRVVHVRHQTKLLELVLWANLTISEIPLQFFVVFNNF